jgi:lambda family phage portal protein
MKNPIDWLIATVNPRAGLARAIARKTLRGFEAADRGRRTAGWRTHSTDADSEIRQGQRLLRDRARAMRRDNPYAERGISAIATNVVGYGIVPDPKGRARPKKRALALWQQWAETPACDTGAMCNFYGMQLLAMQTVAESGEVLIRRKWTPNKNVLNFQLQIFEPDYLDNSRDVSNSDGSYVQDGIAFNANGEKVGYWLFPHHPGSAGRIPLMLHVSTLIPAEDIIHMFYRKRPGQMRGYTWLAPVMLRMRNFDEMEDAVIEQAKIAACFAAFIHADGDNSLPGTPASDRMDWEHIEPGAINRLSENENITFGTPPTFNGYDAYSRQSLRATAVGLGVPYEVLTGDLSGVSFTSGRMGWLEFGRNIDVWRWQMIIPQMCDRVWAWFNEAAMLSAGGFSEAIACGWVAPRRDLIDPVKELQALKDEMRLGALSYSGMLKERGINDTEAHVQQIDQDNELLDANALVFDGDPRKVMAAGSAPVATAPPVE